MTIIKLIIKKDSTGRIRKHYANWSWKTWSEVPIINSRNSQKAFDELGMVK